MLAGLAVGLTGRVAGAQPVTHPEPVPCTVHVVLAPAEVRAEIEAWVRAEPRCRTQLEVRVVPTDDGYHLSARDPGGRARERIVPDARSAAVLVVSWMADDSLGPTLSDAGARSEDPMPVEVAQAPPAEAEALAPAPAPALDGESPPGLVRRADRGRARAWRALTLGAITSSGDDVGVRGQIDLLGGARWSAGLAGGWRPGDPGRGGAPMSPDAGTGEARLVLGTGHTFGRISLRAQLGIGVDLVEPAEHMAGRGGMSAPGGGELVPRAEAGVFATVHLGDAWGLVGGPLVGTSLRDERPLQSPQLSVFLGVQRGL